MPRSERIFQLIALGLAPSFPPLRAESAERGLLKRILPCARPKASTLEEEAWRARALLPKVEPPRQEPLVQLGAALFTAHRAATQADDLLGRIDRKGLVRRADAQREAAVFSERARDEALKLERQISSVDQLFNRRHDLAELAVESASKLDESLDERGIASLRERVGAATAQLDEALAEATGTLDPLSFRLERTRHRGVYRSGRKYVVPFVDTVGIDRRWEFSTRAEARAFRRVIHDHGEIPPPGVAMFDAGGIEFGWGPGAARPKVPR